MLNNEQSGRKCSAISCSKCSEKIDWEQVSGENTIYDATGWCVDCYNSEETKKEIEKEIL